MKKSALIYDKWLSQLGGGEVVACRAARIIKNAGYDVTFLSGKNVSRQEILNKLGVNLFDIEFKTVWNDELEIKKLTQNKDLFINFTFMDYSLGRAKKNIYYTHFANKVNQGVKGKIVNLVLLPALSAGYVPQEPIKGRVQFEYNLVLYSLKKKVKFSYYYLLIGRTYKLEFQIYLPYFSKLVLENLRWNIDGAIIKEQTIVVEHRNNLIKINISMEPVRSTIYFEVGGKITKLPKNFEAYLIYKPIIYHIFNLQGYFKLFQQRLDARFRAGLFRNPIKRIHSYNLVIANSQFTKYWIKKYWNKNAEVIYPPVDLIFQKSQINPFIKKNWICSIGRFFSVGHQKKQEVLINAFKKFYEKDNKNWELHLIGGFDSTQPSYVHINKLKKLAQDYPIYFHLNVSREELERIIKLAKVYWHATGYGENSKRNPINFEHFGISAIEAISAGCIPVLYDGGGLTEIIKVLKLSDLHLFSDIDQLVLNTEKLIKIDNKSFLNKTLIKNLKNNFSNKTFEDNILNLIK